MFDFSEIKDFDAHINMSIPNYSGLLDSVSAVALEYLTPDGSMLDIGCSSGALLNHIKPKTLSKLYGCDLVDMGTEKKYEFLNESGLSALQNVDDIDVITSIFTLQFMGRIERKDTLTEIERKVKDGAIAIIAEKTHINNPRVNTALYRQHQRGKLKSFTSDQILQKDFDLSGSMFPLESNEIENELSSIGRFVQIWQSYNFKCWCCFK
jgi:tRNA (cmo5U34)-methyltransferase